jgi:hypothetical protein
MDATIFFVFFLAVIISVVRCYPEFDEIFSSRVGELFLKINQPPEKRFSRASGPSGKAQNSPKRHAYEGPFQILRAL